MKFTIGKLKELAIESGSNPHVVKFVDDIEQHANREVLEAIRCLESYGYVITPPHEEMMIQVPADPK